MITDEVLQTRWSHEDLARAAAAGGADVVQYREKRPRAVELRMATAKRIVEALKLTPTRCVVNDDVEVALASGAAGVHLGSGDAAPRVARERLGIGGWIGATANDLQQAERRDAEPVDYLGVGPVYGTRSKARPAPLLGLEGLARIVAAVERPVVAIGGIDASNAAAVLATGAAGIAVLSAVVVHADPREATAELRALIDDWFARKVHA